MTHRRPRLLSCGRVAPERRSLEKADLGPIRERLESYLRARGRRFTEPRWKVAEAILLSGLHLDSKGILAEVKKRDRSVGEATVYRAIHFLVEASILEESHQSVTGRTVYEISDGDHHDHIVCMDCDEIFEFHDPLLEKNQLKTANSKGFELVGHRHVLMGRCSFLQKNRGK